MTYPSTKLNGWDCVAALPESEVNKALEKLFHQGSLPTAFSRAEEIQGIKVLLQGEFGPPAVHAVRDELKMCELVLPLLRGSIKTPAAEKALPEGSHLRIKTSLVSLESHVSHAAGAVFDISVDLKDSKAVYDVHIDGFEKGEIAILEQVLKIELQELTGHSYTMGRFVRAEGADSFLPQLVDFSFVLDAADPNQSVFVICGSSSSEGPTVDNRLAFEATILPPGLPASLWFGPNIVMKRGIVSALSRVVSSADDALAYDGRAARLKGDVSLGKLGNSKIDQTLTKLDVAPSRGEVVIESTMKFVHEVIVEIIWDINFGTLRAQVDYRTNLRPWLNADKNSIEFDVAWSDPETVVELPWFALVALGMTGLAADRVASLFYHELSTRFERVTSQTLKPWVAESVDRINSVCALIPAMEDLMVDGHLLFEDVTLHDTGDVCLGVRGIEKA